MLVHGRASNAWFWAGTALELGGFVATKLSSPHAELLLSAMALCACTVSIVLLVMQYEREARATHEV